MKKKLLVALSLVLMAINLTVLAQKTTISPLPQSVSWGDTKAFDNSSTFAIVGAETADSCAVELLRKNLSSDNGSINIIIGERGDAAVSDYTAMIPQKSEGYYLSVGSDKVVIAGNDAAGTYYGVQTFLQIASQPEVMSVTISDYPEVSERGLVEGYYGNPYSHSARLRMFDFFGKQKMNVYIYGPKDDPYHKAQWRVEYPAAEAAKIKALVASANSNKVNFVWAVHPGGDIKWNLTDSMNIVKKFEAMYKLGVRAFAIFFDDISGEGTSATKQAGLLNYVTSEFIKKHSDAAPLIMCPTQYNRSWSSGDYLSILGKQTNSEVRIMWTGNSVVDMINMSDMTWINSQISRKAYIWLNYPVNDYCIDHMLMGPTYGNDNNIASVLGGFTSNPMEYAEASKVSLYSIADYSWNTTNYNANNSWENAIKYLMPNNTKAFHFFCENNIDLGSTYHGLRRDGESPLFVAARDVFNKAMAASYSEAAVDTLCKQFDMLVNYADELLASTSEPEMIEEITPWLNVMKYIGVKGQTMMKMYKSLNAGNTEDFINQYLSYQETEVSQKAVLSRNYSGSIKTPNPAVATTFVEPFLKTKMAELIAEYKSKYDYRTDVFPKQQFDGKYFIMYNGKYLTDESQNVNGSQPHFVSTRNDVNPQRQEWTITLDLETNRFKIVNNQYNRYLNEYGKFSADPTGNNKYEAIWHTYTMQRWANGKVSIKNAGSAGDKYWTVTSDGTAVSQSSSGTFAPSNFIFDIVPIEGEQESTIVPSQTYYIKSGELYLTNSNVNGSGGNPSFKTIATPAKAQEWKFSIDATTSRYKLVSAADSRYVNELGAFGTNAFYSSWNTYNILELGNAFSIQNAGDGGSGYWSVNDNKNIATGAVSLADSYLFTIEPVVSVGISSVSTDADIHIYTSGNKIMASSKYPITTIAVYDTEGRLQLSASDKTSIAFTPLSAKTYIVTAATSKGQKSVTINGK